jgi:flagellar motor switch protein FliM
MFMGEKFGRDTIWEGHLASELWATKVPLEAVLDEQHMTLAEVMNFKVGQTILLNAPIDGLIDLRVGGVTLLQGHMGRLGHHVAVRVDRKIVRAISIDLS